MDLTDAELFKDLMSIGSGISYIDLHNNYFLTEVARSGDSVLLKFDQDKDNGTAVLSFEDVEIVHMAGPLKGRFTLHNLRRCRHEHEGAIYDDFKGKKCFMIEYDDDAMTANGILELLCSKASLDLYW